MPELTFCPIVSDTVCNRRHPEDQTPDVSRWVETVYRLQETDSVWLSLGALTVQRGNRYGGTEETLKIEDYSADCLRSALLQMVSDLKHTAETDTPGGFLQVRAEAFLRDLQRVLAN